MTGSSNEPSINGVFRPNGKTEGGRAVFANSDSSRVLYWTCGKWVIADAVASSTRFAQESDGASPPLSRPWTIHDGPVHKDRPVQWTTQADAERKAEPSIIVNGAWIFSRNLLCACVCVGVCACARVSV